jgi:NAD-dependent dihydropyrimidine dehydrogenase PreA subunit
MDFIEIDKDKCNQDGLCVAVCRQGFLNITKRLPLLQLKILRDVHQVRTLCGSMPDGALKHRSLDIHRFEEVKEEFRLTTEQCEAFFKGDAL